MRGAWPQAATAQKCAMTSISILAPLGGGDLDGGAGREVGGEVLRIHLVHAGEVRQVGEEDGALDDVREGELLVVEDGFDVPQDAVGLGLDVTGDEVSSGRINGNLAGAEQQVADADGVVVRATAGADWAGLMTVFFGIAAGCYRLDQRVKRPPCCREQR